MKKTLLLLAVLFTASQIMFGAAIEWQISGMNKALTNYDGATAANTTVYLILADSSSLASITGLENEADFTSALSAITLSTVTSGTDGKKPATLTSVVSSDLLSAGTTYTFGMLYVSEATDGGYYRYVAATKPAYDLSDPTGKQTASLSWATMAGSTWQKGYAVPEPASAMLALAGVAMLIRRRK